MSKSSKIKNLIFAAIALAISSDLLAVDEIYTYDTLGRVASVTYPSGVKVIYSYDNASNRKATSSQPLGAFTLQSASHSSRGNTNDIVTAAVKNTGGGTITSISVGCVGNGWHGYGTTVSTLAPGATANFYCQVATSGGPVLTMVIGGSNSSGNLTISNP